MVSTKINEEISPELRQNIIEIKNKLVLGIQNKDYEKVSILLSPELLAAKDFNLEYFINQVPPLTTKGEFIVLDQYFSTLRKIGNDSQATIIPSISEKNKFIINKLIFYGKEAYNLFLKSTNSGWQYLLFLSLGKFDEAWKINIMHVGSYSITDLAAPELYEIGKEAMRNGRLTSCVVYSWAIQRCIRPAPFLQYIDEKEYLAFVKSSYSDFNNTISFPFKIADKEFIGLQIVTTDNEGLIPVILYMTDKDLKNPEVDKEVEQLKSEIIKKFYGIDHDFEYVLLRAYNEMPTDSQKQYEVRGTILELKKE
jgi:hypothetical protein